MDSPNEAKKKSLRADVVTYYTARRFLDGRFILLRQDAMNKWSSPDDATCLARYLQVLNRKWEAAVYALKKMVLGRKKKRPRYKRTVTLNPGEKVRARNSYVERAKRGLGHPKRSHHKGHYSKKQDGPGRPRKKPVEHPEET